MLEDPVFDFIGDVWHHLDGLSKIVATTFLVDDRLVDLAGGDGVGLGGADPREALVVAQIEVGLHTIDGDVAFAMLVRV